MTTPWDDLVEVVGPLVDPLPVYALWPSVLEVPCAVVYPTTREHVRSCGTRWTLSLDVVYPLTSDQGALMATAEQVADLPVGWHVMTTNYLQRSVGGADVIVASTVVQTDR